MNYQQHYDNLMNRAKDRNLTGYSERHHILPRCLGGGNEAENLVRLTAEEHYVAHQLLVKIHPGNHRLIWAAMAMTNGTKNHQRSNKVHGWLRRKFSAMLSERHKGRVMSDESKAKMSKARIGKKTQPHSDETKAKMSVASLGKPKSEAHKLACSKARKGKTTKPCSQEIREKIRIRNIETAKTRDFSYLQDADYKTQQSNKMKEIWAKRRSGELPKPNYANN